LLNGDFLIKVEKQATVFIIILELLTSIGNP